MVMLWKTCKTSLCRCVCGCGCILNGCVRSQDVFLYESVCVQLSFVVCDCVLACLYVCMGV